ESSAVSAPDPNRDAGYPQTDRSQPRCPPSLTVRCFGRTKEDPMREFLVAIDGSGGSDAAVDEALALAGDAGAHVTFAVVGGPPSTPLGYPYYERLLRNELATARDTLDAAAGKALAAGIDSESEILEGDPIDEIVSLADNRCVDLIVMGSRGRGAFA